MEGALRSKWDPFPARSQWVVMGWGEPHWRGSKRGITSVGTKSGRARLPSLSRDRLGGEGEG